MGKPTVTLTLAGDETALTKAFDKVGSAANQMGDKVSSSSKKLEDTGKGMGDLADKAGTGEQRFTGLGDVVEGTGDIMTGFAEGDLIGVTRGFADLAGGLEGFLIPALTGLAGFMKGGLAQAMTFISAHPLLITVGLLAAAFVLLWMNSEKFRDIVIGVFDAVGTFAKKVFGGAIDWVVGAWNGMVDWFGKLPERIGQALGAVGGFIGDAFKGGLNLAIDYINFFVRTVNWLTDKVNDVTGLVGIPSIPDIPEIPKLHTGGVLPGAAGEEALFVGLAGERVTAPGGTPHGSTGGRVELVPTGGGGALADFLNALIADGLLEARFR
jgi:phage-related protein